MKHLFFLILCLIGTGIGHAQSALISGLIRDSETLQPVAGAVVVLEGTLLGAQTDELGYYRMSAPDSGSYTLSTSMIGYERTAKTIHLAANAKVEVHFYIKGLEFNVTSLPFTGTVPRNALPIVAEGPPKPEKH